MNQKTALGTHTREKRHRLLIVIITVLAFCLTAVLSGASYLIFSTSTREMKTQTAHGMAKLAADFINADRVNDWLANGTDEEYEETAAALERMLRDTPDVEYIYVYQILEDGCHVVFDFDTDGLAADSFGEVVPFDPTFVPLVPTLLEGGRIAPIESNDAYGWLLTVYEPVYDSSGSCVCYAGADVSMQILRDITDRFIITVSVIGIVFLAFFVFLGARISINYHRADEMDVYKERQKRDKQLIREIVESFAKIIDLKDSYTQGHSTRVAKYTAMLTRELGYDEETVENYYNIALMHDIGKIGIPDEVLNKPGKLDDTEFKIIKSHAQRGYEALKNISLMPEIAVGAGSHHERPDGRGYPMGLKGDEIPRVAQIIAVADTFDAMYSDRPYRKRMNFDKVCEIIREVRGTQLTSDVVDAFLRLVDKGEFRAPDDNGGGSTEDISNIQSK